MADKPDDDEIKTAAPPVALIDTPEFKAALAAGMAEVKNNLMGELAAAMTRQASGGDLKAMVSDLTIAIAGMTDTGNNRKIISPAEAERRVAAWKKMGEVLERIHADHSLMPKYEVVAEMQLEEQLIQKFVPVGDGQWKSTVIIWRGCPNSGMRPLNDIAKEVFGHYLESIGGSTANTAGVREQPTWVGYGGLQVVGQPTQSAANRGLVAQPAEPMELGKDLSNGTREITSVDDPNATRIPILGKSFDPARRVAPGDPNKLFFPAQ